MLCRGRSGILIVDLSFHAQWHLLQVQRQPPCCDGLACPGSRFGVANCTGAFIRVVVAFFGPFEPRSLHQGRFRKKHNSGTATSYQELRVLNKDCAVQKGEAAKL